MAKASGKKSRKNQIAFLEPSVVSEKYVPRMHVDFPIDDIEDLKLGQEVVITIKGCVKELRDKDYDFEREDGCIGVEVYSKTLRKTSNLQAEGIKKLSEDDEDY